MGEHEAAAGLHKSWPWLIGGFLAFVLSIAFIEHRQPYFFAQDDVMMEELPGWIEGCRAVWNGVWPEYDPCRCMGTPHASSGGYMMTYPPVYFSYAIARHLLHDEYAMADVFAIVHLAAGYLVMYLMARRLGIRPSLAMAASLSNVLSGASLIIGRSWITFIPQNVWVPLAIICVDRLVHERVGWRWVLAMSLCGGMLFQVGFVQMWMYAALAIGLVVLLLYAGELIDVRKLRLAILAGIGCIGFSLPLALPVYELGKTLLRPPLVTVGMTSHWLAALLPYPLWITGYPAGFGGVNYQYLGEMYYFGGTFAALFLLAVVFVAARLSWQTLARNAWLVAALVELLIACGKSGPLAKFLGNLPIVGALGNYPMRSFSVFVILAIVGGAVFAERGLRALRSGNRYANALAIATVVLLGYHVAMCKTAFFLFSFKPYPLPIPMLRERAGLSGQRYMSWTTPRSVIPEYAAAAPPNLSQVYELLPLSGYGGLPQYEPGYLRAIYAMTQDPVGAMRAYGVRWHLVSPLMRNVVCVGPPEAEKYQHNIFPPSTFDPIEQQLVVLSSSPGVKFCELHDVAPMAFPQWSPTQSLPLTASCAGLVVDLAKRSTPGPVVVNFLWWPQLEAVADGKPVPCSRDEWGRIVAGVPEGAHKLEIHWVAHWLRGVVIGLALVAASLIAAVFVTRPNSKIPSRAGRKPSAPVGPTTAAEAR